ncbi:hypothetical protein GQ600_20149 [Phytophthora cactorum]|nr:hypothetical protein GQ600_20149 [Phytophthora cactorum]
MLAVAYPVNESLRFSGCTPFLGLWKVNSQLGLNVGYLRPIDNLSMGRYVLASPRDAAFYPVAPLFLLFRSIEGDTAQYGRELGGQTQAESGVTLRLSCSSRDHAAVQLWHATGSFYCNCSHLHEMKKARANVTAKRRPSLELAT